MDNDIVTRNPVDRGGDLVLIAGLEGVDNAEDLSRVTAGGGRVGEDSSDGLLRVNDEDRSDGECNALLVDVGGVLLVDPGGVIDVSAKSSGKANVLHDVKILCDLHVVQKSNLSLLVSNDGESNIATGNLRNVLDPSLVAAEGVGREADQLDTTLGEFRLELGESAEFGRADGSVVLGVVEEDDPVVTDELVEVNGTSSGLGLEVRGDSAQTKTGPAQTY